MEKLDRQPSRIVCNENGLTITFSDPSQPNAFLAWDKVDAVIAYKQDIYTMDQIRLGFVTTGGTIVVTEDMQGWDELVQQLPIRLPNALSFSEWWERVAQPPFALSLTTLYKRV